MFARQYPDSGSIKTMLSDIDKRIETWLKKQEEQNKKWEDVDLGIEDNVSSKVKNYILSKSIPGGSVRAMSAICVQIALENVGCCHYALRVLSRMVDSLKDDKEKWDIRNKTYTKLCNQPNSDYNQLWLQSITYQKDKKNGISPYSNRLCKVVMGEDIELWNNEWIKQELVSNINVGSIVNQETLKKNTPVIIFRESRAYNEQNGYL